MTNTETIICPNCKGHMVRSDSGLDSYLKCGDCGAIQLLFKPLPHQVAFMADKAKFRLYAGGYGSGKTTSSVQAVIKHILTTPNGTTLMTAPTVPQLEQTSQKEFFEKFPTELITNYSKQKGVVDIINGHRVLFRASDDDGKLRSLNLSCWHMEEGSHIKYEIFVQLQTRLRSSATKNHIGIISSNPDTGWIKEEFLLKSNIHGGDVKYYQREEEINPQFSTHIVPTHLNPYLPEDFYETTAKGKPDWWVNRFLHGSFENKTGLVYPDFNDIIVDPFEIPRHWERFVGVDFGILDPTTMLIGAVDPKDGIIYFYREYYKTNQTVPFHAKEFDKLVEDIPRGMLRMPVADPSGKQRSKIDGRSLFDHYGEYGWHFKHGDNRIDNGLMKVLSYMSLGRMKVFKTLKETIEEGLNYKYKENKLDQQQNLNEKPVDYRNHLMDSLRYIMQELPDDPDQLKNISYGFHNVPLIANGKKQQTIPYALQENDEEINRNWTAYY